MISNLLAMVKYLKNMLHYSMKVFAIVVKCYYVFSTTRIRISIYFFESIY